MTRPESAAYDNSTPPTSKAQRNGARAEAARGLPAEWLPASRLGLPGADEARSPVRRLDVLQLRLDRHSSGRDAPAGRIAQLSQWMTLAITIVMAVMPSAAAIVRQA
jgi:hypothetical protein